MYGWPPVYFFLKNGPFLASFLFSSFQYTVDIIQMFDINKFLPMTGFEPRTSGIGSDRSTNWATTTSPVYFVWIQLLCLCWMNKKIGCLFDQIQTSQTGGQPCSDTCPMVSVLCTKQLNPYWLNSPRWRIKANSVWRDWAILERSWEHIFFQKLSKFLMTFWAILIFFTT